MEDLLAGGVRSSLRVGLRAGNAFIRLQEDLGRAEEGLAGRLALSARPHSIPIAGAAGGLVSRSD